MGYIFRVVVFEIISETKMTRVSLNNKKVRQKEPLFLLQGLRPQLNFHLKSKQDVFFKDVAKPFKVISKNLPVATFITHDKGCHRLVSRSGLKLVIGAISFATLATLQVARFCSLHLCQHGRVDAFLHKGLPLALDFVGGHFFGGHDGKLLGCNDTTKHVLTQRWVFLVLQIEDARSHLVLVFGIGLFVVLEDGFFNQFCQLFRGLCCSFGKVSLTWKSTSLLSFGNLNRFYILTSESGSKKSSTSQSHVIGSG